jgi:hypothetical protein
MSQIPNGQLPLGLALSGPLTANGLYSKIPSINSGMVTPFVVTAGVVSGGIDGSKVSHESVSFSAREIFDPLTTIIAATKAAGPCAQNPGVIFNFVAQITGTFPSGNHTVNVDCQHAPMATPTVYTSILTATLAFSFSPLLGALGVALVATPTISTYAAGDNFIYIVTVAGSTGSQGLGLVAWLQTKENPS